MLNVKYLSWPWIPGSLDGREVGICGQIAPIPIGLLSANGQGRWICGFPSILIDSSRDWTLALRTWELFERLNHAHETRWSASKLEWVGSFYHPQNPARHSGNGLLCIKSSGKWLKYYRLCLALKWKNGTHYTCWVNAVDFKQQRHLDTLEESGAFCTTVKCSAKPSTVKPNKNRGELSCQHSWSQSS